MSSASRSTTISKRSWTVSRTWRTASAASSSSRSDGVLALLVFLIAVALVFDFLNGRNDAANSIATIVSTRVLAPRYAVAWAAFFNFVAFLVFGLHVASTVGRGIISPAAISDAVIFGALMGAISWN